jgi:predicted nucleotidyltransferase
MTYSKDFSQIPQSVQDVVRMIVNQSNPQKVSLFGSRARQDFRPNSDFDLCVFGRTCSDSMWNRLTSELDSGSLTLHKIDLVEFEKLDANYRTNILKEGILLYG